MSAALDTKLTSVLVLEGRARDLVHESQQLRKDHHLAATDRIQVIVAAERRRRCLRNLNQQETLAVEIAATSDETVIQLAE